MVMWTCFVVWVIAVWVIAVWMVACGFVCVWWLGLGVGFGLLLFWVALVGVWLFTLGFALGYCWFPAALLFTYSGDCVVFADLLRLVLFWF